MKIRTQMILVLAAVALLPLGAAGLFAYRISRDRLAAQADQTLLTLGRRVATEVDSFAFHAIESVRADSLIPTIVDFVASPPDAKRARRQAEMLELLRSAVVPDPVNVTSCALFDRLGRKLVDTSPRLNALDESERPWVSDPIATGLVSVVPELEGEADTALWVGSPVRNASGEIIGVLRLRYEVSALQQIVAQLSEDKDSAAFAVVFDQDGRVLAHGAETALVGSLALTLPDASPIESGGTRPADAVGWARWSKAAQAGGERDRTATISLWHVPWRVGVAETGAVFSRATDELYRTMLGLGALVVALSGASVFLISARLTHPISRLADTAERIGQGDLSAEVPGSGPGEVGTLARTFNEMTRRLRGTLGELEQKMAEARASEQSLRELIDASPVGIMVTDQETGTMVFNRKFTEVFGYDATDISHVGHWWERAYPDPAVRAGVQDALRKRIAEARGPSGEIGALEGEVTCKDGTRRLIEFLPTRVGRRRITLCVDLTASRRAEQALRESEERYRLLVENSNELVVQVALDGVILYASPNHGSITGRSAEELLGTSVFAHVHPEDLPAIVAKFNSSEGGGLFRYGLKDGAWRWFESSGRRYRLASGEERGVIMSRDVTDRVRGEDARKRLEAQLRQSQKMEAIGTLAGGIAHDFNNILAGLLGHLQLIEMDMPPGPGLLRDSLGEALGAGARAKELVAQILAFSRQREQQRIDVSLGPIVREAIRLLRSSLPATISIKTEVEEGCPQILADPTQMHQVIMNLGANAGHAMRAKGGTLTVSLRMADPGPALAATHPLLRPGHVVCLSLRDTGTGMDPATLDRIFEPFFTTKPVGEGTGLGLAIVHGIAQEHQAAIEVESQLGAGTVFHLYFSALESAGLAPSVAKPSVPRGQGEHVMLVDDEVIVLSAAKPMLQRLGYRVTAFEKSAAAIAAFEKEPAAFDLVVTDLTMPEFTGVELITRIRAVRPAVPVVMTTGYMRAADLESARAIGVRHFLSKPFTLSGMGDILQLALRDAKV